MATLKGSQTEKNLLKAFAGESQARNRYTYFSLRRRRRINEQIAWIFTTLPKTKRNTGSGASRSRVGMWR